MLDATLLESNDFSTSLGSNLLNLSTALPGGAVSLGIDSWLLPNDPKALALTSGVDVNFYLNQHLEQVATASSEASGSIATDLFLFRQQESLTQMLTYESMNAAINEQKVQLSNDSLIGISRDDPLVGNVAQNPTPESNFSTTSVISGTLDRTDPTRHNHHRFHDDYLLTGISAGDQVQVNLNGDFNTYLVLINAQTREVISSNNNSNGTLNSELTFTAQAGVDYLVRTTSLRADVTGDYTLTTNIGTPIPATPITGNKTLRGALVSTDPSNPTRSGRYTDDYLLTGLSTGQTVQVNMNAGFDTYLQVVNANTGAVVTEDDDSGRGTNSQLAFTVESGINYIIRATSYGAAITGNYTLTTNTVTLPDGYNLNSGYGLVDAAAAVANAAGENSPFPDVPNLGGNNWGLDMVNAPEVWAQGYTGQGVVVAVIDTGVDYTHPDLDANIWVNTREIADNGIDDDGNGYIDDVRGWDFVDVDNDPMDFNSHGTHVAGTIAAENNDFGVTGVAYNATIMPVRVLDSDGSGTYADVAAGIRYAADNGANVINLSLGGSYNSGVEEAIQYAAQLGVVVVMAAGNESANIPGYPAQSATDWGIAVGAVNSSNQMPYWSNRAGSTPLDYVVAPGASILSTTPGNTYQSFSGTSMATPHVAGVAALILSANPNLTPAEVESILTQTANPVGITV